MARLDEEERAAGAPEWMVTFSDMMSLLLTFFVMLLAMSDIKQDQTMALIESLRRQFGHTAAPLSVMPGRFFPVSSALNKLPSLGRARRMDTMRGGDKVQAPMGDYARVRTMRPGEDTTQGGVVYFEEGASRLTEDHKRALRVTVRAIGGKPQKIEIRGHTSARPLEPDSPHRNRWDLAYARCFQVMEHLVALGINPQRIRISVAAENEPVHIGYDELLRKKNARVEVLMLDELTEDLQGTKEEKQKKYSTQGAPYRGNPSS